MNDSAPAHETGFPAINETSTGPSPALPKKKRSAVDRVFTWSVIGVLLVVVLNELRAQTGYRNSLRAVEERLVDNAPQQVATLNDARGLMTLGPIESRGIADQRDAVFFRWYSPFKKYEFVFSVASKEEENPELVAVGTQQPAQEGQAESVAWVMLKVP